MVASIMRFFVCFYLTFAFLSLANSSRSVFNRLRRSLIIVCFFFVLCLILLLIYLFSSSSSSDIAACVRVYV